MSAAISEKGKRLEEVFHKPFGGQVRLEGVTNNSARRLYINSREVIYASIRALRLVTNVFVRSEQICVSR